MEHNNGRTGLYTILFRRLDEVQKESGKEIIPFPILFEKLCRTFTINKPTCWDILFLLRDVGLIEIIAGHGVRIIVTDYGAVHNFI